MPDAPTTSYDIFPYGNRTFPRTHPDLLATVATLFGMAPAPPEDCRVLELGCAGGANLIAIKDMAGLCKPAAAERLVGGESFAGLSARLPAQDDRANRIRLAGRLDHPFSGRMGGRVAHRTLERLAGGVVLEIDLPVACALLGDVDADRVTRMHAEGNLL